MKKLMGLYFELVLLACLTVCFLMLVVCLVALVRIVMT